MMDIGRGNGKSMVQVEVKTQAASILKFFNVIKSWFTSTILQHTSNILTKLAIKTFL